MQPPRGQGGDERSAWTCLASVVLIALLYAVLGSFGAWPDNIDNWNYWELSLNLTTDFYHVWNLRSFVAEPGRSISYPPLYPALIAVADLLTGEGPAGGTVVNYACVAGFAVVNGAIGRHLARSFAAGLLVAAATLCFLPFATELASARTHPLALLIVAAIALVVVRGPITPLAALQLGLLAGLGVMARFDFLLPSVALGAIVLFWSRRVSSAGAYVLGAVLVAAPWIAYSWTWFQTPFASDSRWAAAARQPGIWAQDWIAPPGPERMSGVADLLRKLWQTRDVPIELASDLARHLAPVALVLVAAYAGAVIVGRFRPAVRSGDPRRQHDAAPFRRLVWLLLIWPPLVFSVWLANYPSVRYLSAAVWHLFASIVLGLVYRIRQTDTALAHRAMAASAAGLVMLSAGMAWRLSTTIRFETPSAVTMKIGALRKCLIVAGGIPGERVLFAGYEVTAGQFGPLARWNSSSPPHNASILTGPDWSAFLKRNQIIYVVDGQTRPALQPFLERTVLDGCPKPVSAVIPDAP